MSKIYVDEIAGIASADTVAIPGHVIQVVQHTFNTPTESNTASTWLDWGPSGSITPTSSTSKILVKYSGGGLGIDCNSIALRLLRSGSTVMGRDRHMYVSSSPYYTGVNWEFSYLDSPATTSSTEYKVQINMQASGSIRIADADLGYLQNQNAAVMILMEIAG